MAEIRVPPRLPTPATLDPSGFSPVPEQSQNLSLPVFEVKTGEKIKNLQRQMGIPTEDEFDPLAPGTTDQELWPAQPGGQWIDYRVV